MLYPTALKTARMTAQRDYLNSGFIELLNSGGAVLASVPLNSTSGTVTTDTLTMSGFPKTVAATLAGTIAAVRVRAVDGNSITAVSFGIVGSGMQVIIDNGLGTLAVLLAQNVTISGSPAPTFVHAA